MNDYYMYPVPEASSVLGTDGNYADPRIMVRNLAYDALLGELADEVLYKVFNISPVSEDGREALLKDTERRLSKVVAAMPIIETAVDTILRIVTEYNLSDEFPEDFKKAMLDYHIDVSRRCCLAALSALVDLGLVESNLPVSSVNLLEEDDEDE